MGKPKKVAYVVFKGKTPGVYYNWPDCSAQVTGVSGSYQEGFFTTEEAERAWGNSAQNPANRHIVAGSFDPQADAKPVSSRRTASFIDLTGSGSEDEAHFSPQKRKSTADPEESPYFADLWSPGDRAPSKKKIKVEARSTVKYGPASDKVKTECPQSLATGWEFSNSQEVKEEPRTFASPAGSTMKNEGSREDEPRSFASFAKSAPKNEETEEGDALCLEGPPVTLAPEQQAAVELALEGHNMFLTGAAGSGKTATLKEILRRFSEKYKGSVPGAAGTDHCVQVVAPTGIAALPLEGRTTYSFAGWKPDSCQEPIYELLGNVSKRVRKTIDNVKVLIIEEISMVENQFLERLHMLMQSVQHELDKERSPSVNSVIKPRPFGGKQVIFIGDFHQLPPVKPFQFCLQCGELMSDPEKKPSCPAQNCKNRGVEFRPGDKWAFKAPVWAQLALKHVKLRQIHRQKDLGFQDVLNKIRDGILLTNEEWVALTAQKTLPGGAFAVRLMSRRADVDRFNGMQLRSVRSPERCWKSLDECHKAHYDLEDQWPPLSTQIAAKIREYLASMKTETQRMSELLTLKVGAKVVLLSNISPERGLVNGSQGEVIKFVDTKEWKKESSDEVSTKSQRWREMVDRFQSEVSYWCPVVRFTHGITTTVWPVPQDELKGTKAERYVLNRTQIPLALAWALSIHKSQGMTLSHVHVSSKDIFETGQLYVGCSRAKSIEGLTVTGFSREQLPVDDDVIKFYSTTKWEDLELVGRAALGPLSKFAKPIIKRPIEEAEAD